MCNDNHNKGCRDGVPGATGADRRRGLAGRFLRPDGESVAGREDEPARSGPELGHCGWSSKNKRDEPSSGARLCRAFGRWRSRVCVHCWAVGSHCSRGVTWSALHFEAATQSSGWKMNWERQSGHEGRHGHPDRLLLLLSRFSHVRLCATP